MLLYPFNPHRGSTQTLTAGASALEAALDPTNRSVRILNTGASVAYVAFGQAGMPAATATDCPIAAGQATTLSKGVGQNAMSYISSGGTTLLVTTGEGF